jgi:hypothetical protein
MRTITTDDLERRTARLDLTGIDLAAFGERPLDDATLRCLRSMHDVELHTICYLRDLLVTPAHRDPEVTTFLTFWVYEEYWHGHAIAQVLAVHDESAGAARVAPLRARLGWRDRVKPLAMQMASLVGPEIVALQMAWGAINEWTTQAAYARLAARDGHPVLVDLLHRIMKQEGRHIDYYVTQANARLAESRRARRLTRWGLRRFWSPVGSGLLPDAEVGFLCRHLFDDADGRAMLARIDRRIDRLPGLDGLALMDSIPTALAPAA